VTVEHTQEMPSASVIMSIPKDDSPSSITTTTGKNNMEHPKDTKKEETATEDEEEEEEEEATSMVESNENDMSTSTIIDTPEDKNTPEDFASAIAGAESIKVVSISNINHE
jgi:hypothetical protein